MKLAAWKQGNWFFRQLLASKRIKSAHKRKQADGLFAKLMSHLYITKENLIKLNNYCSIKND
jgi:hypothetical protein